MHTTHTHTHTHTNTHTHTHTHTEAAIISRPGHPYIVADYTAAVPYWQVPTPRRAESEVGSGVTSSS